MACAGILGTGREVREDQAGLKWPGPGVSNPAAVSGFLDRFKGLEISECCMILAGIVRTGFGDVLYLIRSKQMNRGKLYALFKEIYCFKDWNMLI